jgi:BirA family biotin operon repressor/biotin-[acetyl-CoA-carboxylase] ligase
MTTSYTDLASYRRVTGRIGRRVSYIREVGSTNDVALAAGRRGEDEGFIVIADVQTAGRGRQGRHWLAPAGSSLLVSILFHPPEPLSHFASRVTMVCGVGLVEAARAVAGASVWLKWPNDLIAISAHDGLAWTKLAGMLTEIEPAGADLPASVVVGIGLNINVPEAHLAHLAPNASSLQALTGCEVNRAPVLDALVGAIDRRYTALLDGADPFSEWCASQAWLGQSVEVRGPMERLVGVVGGFGDDGALLLHLPGGDVRRITAGDVSVRPA